MPVQNYAEKYSSELSQATKQGTLTNELLTEGVTWLGAKTFRVPSIATSGYKSHNRSGGFQSGSWDIDDTPYTIQQDRSIEFFVDSMDVDETNEAASAANITKVFLNEHANPEIDAYRFSRLYQNAGHNDMGQGVQGTPKQILARFKRDLRKLRKWGTKDTLCYVSTEAMSAIEEARESNITINVQGAGTEIETRVTKIDGVDVIEVFDRDRFWTNFDFSDGFSPSNYSYELNWVMVNKKAVIAAVKHAVVYLFKPGEHTQGDGYLYQNRIYHDLFVPEKNQDGVVVSSGGIEVHPEEYGAMGASHPQMMASPFAFDAKPLTSEDIDKMDANGEFNEADEADETEEDDE